MANSVGKRRIEDDYHLFGKLARVESVENNWSTIAEKIAVVFKTVSGFGLLTYDEQRTWMGTLLTPTTSGTQNISQEDLKDRCTSFLLTLREKVQRTLQESLTFDWPVDADLKKQEYNLEDLEKVIRTVAEIYQKIIITSLNTCLQFSLDREHGDWLWLPATSLNVPLQWRPIDNMQEQQSTQDWNTTLEKLRVFFAQHPFLQNNVEIEAKAKELVHKLSRNPTFNSGSSEVLEAPELTFRVPQKFLDQLAAAQPETVMKQEWMQTFISAHPYHELKLFWDNWKTARSLSTAFTLELVDGQVTLDHMDCEILARECGYFTATFDGAGTGMKEGPRHQMTLVKITKSNFECFYSFLVHQNPGYDPGLIQFIPPFDNLDVIFATFDLADKFHCLAVAKNCIAWLKEKAATSFNKDVRSILRFEIHLTERECLGAFVGPLWQSLRDEFLSSALDECQDDASFNEKMQLIIRHTKVYPEPWHQVAKLTLHHKRKRKPIQGLCFAEKEWMLPSLSHFKELNKLKLITRNKELRTLEGLNKIPKLEHLIIQINEPVSISLSGLSKCSKLRSFEINSVLEHDLIEKLPDTLERLTFRMPHRNDLQHNVLIALTKMPNLKSLSLSGININLLMDKLPGQPPVPHWEVRVNSDELLKLFSRLESLTLQGSNHFLLGINYKIFVMSKATKTVVWKGHIYNEQFSAIEKDFLKQFFPTYEQLLIQN